MKFSATLEREFDKLTKKQQLAIPAIVAAEADGLPVAQLLKTTYSCPGCGRVLGRSNMSRDARQALLEDHLGWCENDGRGWKFVAAKSTYYGEWLRDDRFVLALAGARGEVRQTALSEAVDLLKVGTLASVRELLRQVAEGERDLDRRSAAVALLDWADISTAGKSASVDRVADFLQELKEAA